MAVPLALALACGDGHDDADGTPVGGDHETDLNYPVPSERIVASDVPMMDEASIRQLGLSRSGLDGTGTRHVGQTRRYVSALMGDDDNDGSETAPWQSLQHAADAAEPGSEILVDASADYPGSLHITRSGRANAYIIFRNADPAQSPRLVGDPEEDAVVWIDASYIVFQGFEIAGHQRSSNEEDAIAINIEAESASIGHIEIRNNTVHDLGPGLLDERQCYYNGHGIIAQSEGFRISDLIIDGNELYQLYVGHSECLVVNGNIDGFWITNNYVHDVNNIAIDIIGYEKSDSETTRDGYVADNIILDASNYWPYCTRGNCAYPAGDESSDGIYVDGGADIIIEYNVVGRSDHGIELQSENGELIRNVEVRYNAVFNSYYKNFTLGDAENSREYDNVFFDAPALADKTLAGCMDG